MKPLDMYQIGMKCYKIEQNSDSFRIMHQETEPVEVFSAVLERYSPKSPKKACFVRDDVCFSKGVLRHVGKICGAFVDGSFESKA